MTQDTDEYSHEGDVDPEDVAVLPTRHKVFQVAMLKDEPIGFTLEFELAGGEKESHDFLAYGELSAGATMAFSSMIRYDARGRRTTDINGLRTFFDRALLPDSLTRFNDLLDSDQHFIQMEVLNEVFGWLLEEASGRPTKRPRGSATSRSSAGRSSTGKRR